MLQDNVHLNSGFLVVLPIIADKVVLFPVHSCPSARLVSTRRNHGSTVVSSLSLKSGLSVAWILSSHYLTSYHTQDGTIRIGQMQAV